MEFGCSDGGCIFGHKRGMHTNGGCRCLQRDMSQDQYMRVKRGINFLRQENERLNKEVDHLMICLNNVDGRGI